MKVKWERLSGTKELMMGKERNGQDRDLCRRLKWKDLVLDWLQAGLLEGRGRERSR